jgi:Holliday junction resolvase RusA-like endonuclease
MDQRIKLTIPDEPRGKGRPRFRIVKPRGKPEFVHTYTDSDTVKYEIKIKDYAAAAMGQSPPFEGKVALFIHAYCGITESWTKAKKHMALINELAVVGKFDLDNIVKIAQDAMNGIVYADDKQIYSISAMKEFSHTPRLEIIVIPVRPLQSIVDSVKAFFGATPAPPVMPG